MVSYVLMGLAEYAPIVTIESLDNLITKSDIKRTYSPRIVVSFSASSYPQLETDESLSGIHNTFRAKTDPHLCNVYC